MLGRRHKLIYVSPLFLIPFPYSEAATEGVPCKKVFFKILQNSQENTCGRVFFSRFPVNFAKFLRTSFLQNTFG